MQGQQIRTTCLGRLWAIHFPPGVDAWARFGKRLAAHAGGTDAEVIAFCRQIETELDAPLYWRRDPAIELTTGQMAQEHDWRSRIRYRNRFLASNDLGDCVQGTKLVP